MARPGADLFVVLGISTSEEGNQHAPEFPFCLCLLNRSLPYVSSYVAILLEYIFMFDAARIILTTRTTRAGFPPLAVAVAVASCVQAPKVRVSSQLWRVWLSS